MEFSRGRYQGYQETRLTKVGLRQALLAKKYLSKVKFSNIYSSPQKRALDTANILAKKSNCKVIIRENLRELNFGTMGRFEF